MQHSLFSRFRGTLLGTALGEVLGMNCIRQIETTSTIRWFEADRWGFAPPRQQDGWGKLAILQIHHLLREHETTDRPTELSHPPEADTTSPSLIPPPGAAVAAMAIMALPIALLHHEGLASFHNQLQQIIAVEPTTPELVAACTGALVVGHAIALALREHLHPPALVDQLMSDLHLPDRHPQLAQQLAQVQTWVEQRVGLAPVQAWLKEMPRTPQADLTDLTPIAIAFYGFLSTPDAFKISLLRTARLQEHPQISVALVGALSGAYNGIAGIPVEWYGTAPALSTTLQTLWGVSSVTELLQQADQLLALWSGVHQPSQWLKSPQFSLITASAGLIRPR